MGWKLCIAAARLVGLALVVPALALTCSAADPVVSNVAFAQRPGTKLVDITYDLAADGEVDISVTISADGGTMWTVPATSLSGDVSDGVESGVGKTIVWDFGADWGGQHTAQLRVRVTATQADIPAQGDYLVIDLAAGSAAASYPVSYLAAVPAGGWTAEHKTTKLVLRRIPAATFVMGSPVGELGRNTDDPQHQVTLTKDLYVGVFEMTQKQWERVMGTWPSWFNNATYRDTRPVEEVSYIDIRGSTSGAAWPASNSVDATSFMGILRQKTGLATLDLPTESQWEYACRAGTTTALNSGKNLTDTTTCPNMAEVGRYYPNGGSGYGQTGNLSVGTAGAGSYLPNAWGLYDMHGNVWEWCLDWYGSYPGTVTDPGGAAGGASRVSRGGGWYFNARYCRSAWRSGPLPSGRSYGLGFRLVRTVQ